MIIVRMRRMYRGGMIESILHSWRGTLGERRFCRRVWREKKVREVGEIDGARTKRRRVLEERENEERMKIVVRVKVKVREIARVVLVVAMTLIQKKAAIVTPTTVGAAGNRKRRNLPGKVEIRTVRRRARRSQRRFSRTLTTHRTKIWRMRSTKLLERVKMSGQWQSSRRLPLL